jgi:DNA-binding IclR family transcriptional regulator
VRALYPDRSAFVQRHEGRPTSLSVLRTVLAETRQRGYALEDGEITPGLASVGVAVLDHNGVPLAGIAVTYPTTDDPDVEHLVREVGATAAAVSRRIGGHG